MRAKLPVTPEFCVRVTVPEPSAPTVNVHAPPAQFDAAACNCSCVMPPFDSVVVGATNVFPADAPSLTARMVTTSPDRTDRLGVT
jgi:hypothetical protein